MAEKLLRAGWNGNGAMIPVVLPEAEVVIAPTPAMKATRSALLRLATARPRTRRDPTRWLFLDNHLLRRALQSQALDQAERTEQLLLGAVRSLAHALEAKDAYTGGHSTRVSAYSIGIARELGLSVAETAAVALGGELHDIGKIGVREDILHKPGPLTPDEYRHVMEHTVIGTRILSPLLHNRSTVLAVVRSHHERPDGTSLPDGLKGDGIPLAARIVAVADAFDAMTSKRPYRPALSVEAALRELEENVGSQFDEDCVRAAHVMLQDKRIGPAAPTRRAAALSRSPTTGEDSGTRRKC